MPKTDTELMEELARAIVPNVVFDGWSPAAFEAACEISGIDPATANRICPRGAIDLAVHHHVHGDNQLADAMDGLDLVGLKYSQKVARAIEARLHLAGDKEIVRRATSLFALPHLAVEGAGLIWGTADTIWNGLGDTSDDFNWYSKRAILASVYAATVLFWLGDQSNGDATRAFIERRIANVMQFEKFKADAKSSRVFGPLATRFEVLTSKINAPSVAHKGQFPGFTKT